MSLETAIQYAEDIRDNKIVSNKWVKLAVNRFFGDIEKGLWEFDADAADRVCGFFPDFVTHAKGELAGKPYELSGWESFILINLFGWKDKKTGYRRYRQGYVEVARKNSKSTFCSGISLYMTAFDNEGGAECYTAATDRDQAGIVFGDAKTMIKNSPDLLKVFGKPLKNAIVHESSASRFKALHGQGERLDGLNVHCAIIDEIHAHKRREVFDVLETATGARTQSLVLSITTAGDNKHGIGYEQREYSTKILDKLVDDDSYFAVIYTLDEDDDPFDESVWVKANPNLNRSKKIDDMRRLAKKAHEMPSARNNFLTKHLNVWINAAQAWMDVVRWSNLPAESEWAEPGSRCYVGLDLSAKKDVTALVCIFPMGDKIKIKCKLYLPEERIHDKARNLGNMYRTWSEQGYLKLTDGEVVDQDYIFDDLSEIYEKYDVAEIGFDSWNATQFTIRCMNEGFNLVELKQNVRNLSEPMKELEKMVFDGKIIRDKNPMFDWMMSNVVVTVDKNENIYPFKEHEDNKIDAPVATFNAMNRYLLDDATGIDDFINNMIMVE